MKDEIKEILDKFDKVLENYELDKKWGQMSVDSICHLFPSEMIVIKDYITNLQEENERLKENNKKKTSRCTERNHRIRTKERILERRNKKISKLQQQLDKYKNVIDKIKEYCELNKEFTPRLEDIEIILNGDELICLTIY